MTAQVWKRITKLAFLTITGGIFSLLNFYYFSQALFGQASSAWPWVLSGVAFLVVFLLQIFFIQDLPVLVPIAIAQGGIALIPFLALYQNAYFLYFVGGGTLVLIFFLVSAVVSGRKHLDNSLRVKFFSTANKVIPKVLFGALIFLVVVSYFHLFYLGNFTAEKGKNLFDSALENSEGLVQTFFPGLDFDMSMGKALDQITEVQIKRSKTDYLQKGVIFSHLPEVAKNRIRNKVSKRVREKIEGLAGQTIDSSQNVKDYLFSTLQDKISSLSSTVLTSMKVGSFLLIFFAVKSLLFVIYIPIEFIAFLVYKFLLITSFASVIYENRSKETIIV